MSVTDCTFPLKLVLDLVVVVLDYGIVLCVPLICCASTKVDGRGTDHVPQDTATSGGGLDQRRA